MNFGELVNSLAAWSNQSGNESVISLIREEINSAYKMLARGNSFKELVGRLDAGVAFTSGKGYITLPEDAALIYSISDSTTDISLDPVALEHLAEDNVSTLTTNGRPVTYHDFGIRAIKVPLSIDDTITVVSSDAGDNTSTSVRIMGLDENDELVTIDRALDGTTPVVTTGTTWRQGWSITSIGTSARFNGVITFTESTSTDEIAKIQINERTPRYNVIFFDQQADAANSLVVLYKKRVRELTQDDDVFMIPVEDAIKEIVRGKLRQFDKNYDQARDHSFASREHLGAVLTEQRGQGRKGESARADYDPGVWKRY